MDQPYGEVFVNKPCRNSSVFEFLTRFIDKNSPIENRQHSSCQGTLVFYVCTTLFVLRDAIEIIKLTE